MTSLLTAKLQTSKKPLNDLEIKNELGFKYVVCMVGLPARGKSYISKKLSRYLNWCGFKTRVFNVGNKRRNIHEEQSHSLSLPTPANIFTMPRTLADQPLQPSGTTHDAGFFDATNLDAALTRDKFAMDTLEEAIDWLKAGGKVAIHDATNTTVERRQRLVDRINMEPSIRILFIESICNDASLLNMNIKLKLNGPDYLKMDPEDALQDFKKRIANYEKVYEPISDEEEAKGLCFIKLVDVGRKVIAHAINGYIPSQCVFYLMQIHIKKRTIWLSRHGESLNNVADRIGGDPELTAKGKEYSEALAKFVSTSTTNLSVWTSTLERTKYVARFFENAEISHIKFLNELYAGKFDGMTFSDFERDYPDEHYARQLNKLLYRYPGGESYLDVIERLRPVIVELERMESDLLVITHQVVLRTLLAYFTGCSLTEMPNISCPLHTCYRLTPMPYGVELQRFVYNFESKQFVFVGTEIQ